MTLKIVGTICPNDYVMYYDWFGLECTSPSMVQDKIDKAGGDLLDVEINSPGGEIAAGSEIYTLLKTYGNIKIHITGQACSAASIIAMAGWCEMSPTALMMVHCVSSRAEGNHNDMEKMAEVLKTADEALCNAYMDKSGMSKEEVLDMMEQETWLTAKQAEELKLIDAIMFEGEDPLPLTASLFGLPTEEQMEEVRQLMHEARVKKQADESLAEAKNRFEMLKIENDSVKE